ncbi:uncharacterized protein LOC133823478 isoform X2 [Humulus lupulus]|uniref:uncharacterized protein LOC133823478 isoform X2 n=1 Tax=Humulus lupulus TaxID=3486 RepID=UPI002B414A5D|nr:uncharacterized protein LOC133823478 isoform X2 [Humulus lupulus]XP_062112266.1 uncharacterized protein LOC133823478 isoform X2 [Humulus lupulus]
MTVFCSANDQIVWNFEQENDNVLQLGGSGFDYNMYDIEDGKGIIYNGQKGSKCISFPLTIFNCAPWGGLEVLTDDEKVLMNYVMNPNLPAEEIVFLGDKVVGRKCHFLTLAEKQLVSAKIYYQLWRLVTMGRRGSSGGFLQHYRDLILHLILLLVKQ